MNLDPKQNKFHKGNGEDGKHYWLTPWDEPAIAQLVADYGPFDFDPCPYPKPDDFDGLTCEWGQRNWVNPPFGSIMHHGKKKGPTAWMRKAIEEQAKGKLSVVVYPVDKWVLGARSKLERLNRQRANLTKQQQLACPASHVSNHFVQRQRCASVAIAALAEIVLPLPKNVESFLASLDDFCTKYLRGRNSALRSPHNQTRPGG